MTFCFHKKPFSLVIVFLKTCGYVLPDVYKRQTNITVPAVAAKVMIVVTKQIIKNGTITDFSTP